MNKDLALEALKKIQEICPTSFILFGTLLGCMRNGEYIPWDCDMDLGILYEDWKEEYAEKFKKEGFVTLVDVFWSHPKSETIINKELLGKRSKLQMYYKEQPIRICFEVFGKGINNHRYSGAGGAPRIFHCREDLILKTVKHPFYDILVNIPEKYDEFLTLIYGENWKIPDRKYMTSALKLEKEKEWKILLND